MAADRRTPHLRVRRLAVSLRRLALGTSGVRGRGVCAAGQRGGVAKESALGAGGWEVRFISRPKHDGGVRGVVFL